MSKILTVCVFQQSESRSSICKHVRLKQTLFVSPCVLLRLMLFHGTWQHPSKFPTLLKRDKNKRIYHFLTRKTSVGGSLPLSCDVNFLISYIRLKYSAYLIWCNFNIITTILLFNLSIVLKNFVEVRIFLF